MDVSALLAFKVSPLELFVRGSLMYWFLFLIFRFLLRRDVGAVGIADVLLVVLIADASQNAMGGGYDTVAEGCVLVATLVGWNYLLDWASWRFAWMARWVEPPPLPLIRHGKLLMRNLRQEHLTPDDVLANLRQHGIDAISQVRKACLESDGNFSVIAYDRGARRGQPDAARPDPAASDDAAVVSQQRLPGA